MLVRHIRARSLLQIETPEKFSRFFLNYPITDELRLMRALLPLSARQSRAPLLTSTRVPGSGARQSSGRRAERMAYLIEYFENGVIGAEVSLLALEATQQTARMGMAERRAE